MEVLLAKDEYYLANGSQSWLKLLRTEDGNVSINLWSWFPIVLLSLSKVRRVKQAMFNFPKLIFYIIVLFFRVEIFSVLCEGIERGPLLASCDWQYA